MTRQIQEVGELNLDAVAELATRCFGQGWGRAALGETLASPAARMKMVVGDGEPVRLLGFLVARRIADIVEIDLLGVASEFRRQGHAVALLEDLIRVEAADGAREVRLELREGNRAAQRLYAELGFVVVGTRARYYPDGENAVLLTRWLSPKPRTES